MTWHAWLAGSQEAMKGGAGRDEAAEKSCCPCGTALQPYLFWISQYFVMLTFRVCMMHGSVVMCMGMRSGDECAKRGSLFLVLARRQDESLRISVIRVTR